MTETIGTVAEYFAGIGLVGMGLEPCGWQIVFANDISNKKKQMFEAFFPGSGSLYRVKNIFKLHAADIPRAILGTCSFPCIDLSLAGNMNGMHGEHSSAFWGFIDVLAAQGDRRPPLLLIENVPGWLHSNKGDDFRLTVQALNDLGYTCDVFVLDALRFRPQSRLRVFLIGTQSPALDGEVDRLLQRPSSLLSQSLKKAVTRNHDLKWTYHSIPEPPALKSAGLSDIIEELDTSDSRWWPFSEVDRHLKMMNEEHHSRVMQLMDSQTPVYRTFFRRIRDGIQRAEVRSDDIAGCLRTAVGGSGKQFLIKLHRGKIMMRAMTPREYARLQGVPDRFPIMVNGVQALTAFGDAVCVPAISWIARNVLNQLARSI